jgi:membrane-associated phospholipid phosphatase
MSWLRTIPDRFLARERSALWTGLALLGLVGVMVVVVPTGPLAIDQRWSRTMEDIQTPFLTHLALIFNALGRGLGRALSLAAVGIALAASRRWLALAAFGVIEALTSLTSTLLKVLVGRPRPPDGLVHPLGSSFPSGHAAYAGATCVALVVLFTLPGRRRWWWTVATLGVVGMAWSRTYLQVHWLSDVIGGSLLGIGISLTVFAGIQWLATARRSDLGGGA